MSITVDELFTYAKKKGFVFRTSEIYGGMAGFFDFGPLGVELKNNVKQLLWKRFVHSRSDVVGLDGSIISHPKVWQASGHTQSFADLMLTDSKTGDKVRADTYIEDKLKISAEGMGVEEIQKAIDDNKLLSPKNNPFLPVTSFNLMFTTNVGAAQGNEAYLRPETAQLIFSNFKQIVDTSRVKLPFGIAQIGKAFRNEISPRDFLFRTREFEQFEIEYFVNPKKDKPEMREVNELTVNILSADGKEHKMTVKDAVEKGIISSRWLAYWLSQFYRFFTDYGISPDNLRLREHHLSELAHYASACFDIEYKFPFGWKEIHGNADRGTYDLDQHSKHSGIDMTIFDEEDKVKVLPTVASEPSQGIERAMLAFMFEAYDDDKKRGNVVMRFHPAIAPIKVAVFPLVNKLDAEGRSVFDSIKGIVPAIYDRSGSVGRRYARADEQGIPYCVTIDFEDKHSVTIRDRDSTEQVRVTIKRLEMLLPGLASGSVKFSDLAKDI